MGIVTELRAQFVYQRKLARLLGWKDSLRFRGAMVAARIGKTRGGTIRLHPRALKHPVELRLDSTDSDVYGQVLGAREYEAVIDERAEVIVDCGANIGLTSAYFLSRLPTCRVIAIEPFAENAELCRRNLAPYGERAMVIEAAVWNCCTTLVLDYAGGNEWGVRVRAALPGETGQITAVDLPSLSLEKIDILKIDIEGSEADLFAQGSEAWLPRVANIAIELHDPVCEARFWSALAGYRYERSGSGELTICRRITREP